MAHKSKLKKEVLSDAEKTFVEYYYDQSSPTFANGTQSLLSAFGKAKYTTREGTLNYNAAGVAAYELLRIPKIFMAGQAMLNRQGFNDTSVEAQHTFLINQSAELGTKAKAVDMFYKLKNKYPNSKMELTGKDGAPLIPTSIVIKIGNDKNAKAN